MSAITDCPKYVIVPNDPSRPIVGILTVADGRAEERFLAIAEELGFKPGEYEFRELIDLDQLYDDAGKVVRLV